MYPRAEYREGYLLAKEAGVPNLGLLDDYSYNVPILERKGFLPRDRERVRREVDRATAAARVRMESRELAELAERQQSMALARRVRSMQRAGFRDVAHVTGGAVARREGRGA